MLDVVDVVDGVGIIGVVGVVEGFGSSTKLVGSVVGVFNSTRRHSPLSFTLKP